METSFQTGTINLTLEEIAAMLGGTLEGPADLAIHRLASAETADPNGLAFAEKQKYIQQAVASGVGALLIGPKIDAGSIPAIRVPNPRLAFFILLTKSDRPYAIAPGIHETAIIDPEAKVDAEARVGPYTVIERFAVIERGATVHAFAYVGEHCTVCEDAAVMPHAVLLRNVELGARSVVFPGAVLGGEGFGFVWDGSKHMKIPQVGRVVIGPDCEIGSLSAIDRATAGSTNVGAGSKIDNLVQVAHNVRLGEHVVIAASSAIAGSSVIGDRVTLGGQTGVGDHITIGSDIVLAGRAGVESDIKEPGTYLDFPAHPAGRAQRNMVHKRNLSVLVERIQALEAKLAKLEAERS